MAGLAAIEPAPTGAWITWHTTQVNGRLEKTFLILPLIGDMSFVSGLRPLLELVMPPVLGLVAILRGLALLANWDTSPDCFGVAQGD